MAANPLEFMLAFGHVLLPICYDIITTIDVSTSYLESQDNFDIVELYSSTVHKMHLEHINLSVIVNRTGIKLKQNIKISKIVFMII